MSKRDSKRRLVTLSNKKCRTTGKKFTGNKDTKVTGPQKRLNSSWQFPLCHVSLPKLHLTTPADNSLCGPLNTKTPTGQYYKTEKTQKRGEKMSRWPKCSQKYHKKYWKVMKSTDKLYHVSESIIRIKTDERTWNTESYENQNVSNVLGSTKTHWEVPENTKKYQKLSKLSQGCLKYQKVSKRIKRKLKVLKMYKKNVSDFFFLPVKVKVPKRSQSVRKWQIVLWSTRKYQNVPTRTKRTKRSETLKSDEKYQNVQNVLKIPERDRKSAKNCTQKYQKSTKTYKT